jgi:hypothetical protein
LVVKITYVTTLEHELGDNSVESTSGVTEAWMLALLGLRGSWKLTLLSSAESPEVLSSLGDDIVVELELDSASGGV